MGEIRTFTEEYVADVSQLCLRGMRGRSEPAGAALQAYFRDIFFASPWSSPDFPSLVYFDHGKLVGFLGVVPRQMKFRGRCVNVAVATQFTIDREQHRGFAAMELLRRLFKGPQDLTYTDGAGDPVHVLWSSAGAHPSRLYSFVWRRVLRPFGTARSFTNRIGGPLGILARTAGVAAAPLDLLASKLPVAAFRTPRSECISTPLDTEQMFHCMQEVGWREALAPSYDLPSFSWLMAQTAANRASGEILMTAVHKPGGDLCGYYICQVQRGGAASVLQIGVRRRDHFDHVLEALFRDACLRGASSVKGPAIPSALVNLTNHYCLFRQANTSVLFQSRDSAITEAILSGDAALSWLDGECWLRFATESWT